MRRLGMLHPTGSYRVSPRAAPPRDDEPFARARKHPRPSDSYSGHARITPSDKWWPPPSRNPDRSPSGLPPPLRAPSRPQRRWPEEPHCKGRASLPPEPEALLRWHAATPAHSATWTRPAESAASPCPNLASSRMDAHPDPGQYRPASTQEPSTTVTPGCPM